MTIKKGEYYYLMDVSGAKHIGKIMTIREGRVTLNCSCNWNGVPQAIGDIERDWKLLPYKELALMKLKQ